MVVRFTRDWLIEHTEHCKAASCIPGIQLAQRKKQAKTQHEHGSIACVSAFLGSILRTLLFLTYAFSSIHAVRVQVFILIPEMFLDIIPEI